MSKIVDGSGLSARFLIVLNPNVNPLQNETWIFPWRLPACYSKKASALWCCIYKLNIIHKLIFYLSQYMLYYILVLMIGVYANLYVKNF